MSHSNIVTRLFLILCAFAPVQPALGCDPLPTFLYPANEIYWGNGWPIPELDDNTIAIVGDQNLSKTVYKEWLYKKIGFNPVHQKRFMMNKTIKQQLQDRGVNTEQEHQLILDSLFDFEVRKKLVRSGQEWLDESLRNKRAGVSEPATFRPEAIKRLKDSYLTVLYIIQHWNEIYPAVFEKFGVDAFSLTITGADPKLTHLIQLNNAYFLSQRYAVQLDAYLVQTIPFRSDLLHQYESEYIEWVFDRHQTPYLTENYIGAYLAIKRGKENNIPVSPESVNDLVALRLNTYTSLVEEVNRSLPAASVPMDVSPVYKEFIREEAYEDLLKSKMIRMNNPLRPHEVVKAFYDQFGVVGQQCTVLEIFKWVRIRRSNDTLPGYTEYAETQEQKIYNELSALREKILAAGPESFPIYAMIYTQNPEQQPVCGWVDIASYFGGDYVQTLDDVALNEISSVRKTPFNTLNLFWLAEQSEISKRFYTICRTLPAVEGFDFKQYNQDLSTARAELEKLKTQIENGASIEELAKTHSDSYNRHGVDISSIYQTRYGFAFAKELTTLPDGALAILSSDEGLHLVKLVSRQLTPFSEDIQNQIIHQYDDGLASPMDRYKLTESFLYEVHPYFVTN